MRIFTSIVALGFVASVQATNLFAEEVFPPVPVPPKPASLTDKISVSAQNSGPLTFTDSQGRTTLYQYTIPNGMDTSKPQPVMMYLHGNNSGTQQRLIDDFYWFLARKAVNNGMIFVMPTSPELNSTGQWRHWDYVKDVTLIREFISQQLPQHFKVDKRQFYFVGASQGTCFINTYLPEGGEGFAGGFFGGCGCYNFRDPRWEPSQDLRRNLKIYVSSTQGDFLLDPSINGANYYESKGFDVKRDLTQAGGHCEKVWSQLDTAIDWFNTFPRVPAPGGGLPTEDIPFKDSFE